MDESAGNPDDRTARSEAAARLGRIAGLRARAVAKRAGEFAVEHEAELRQAGSTAAHLAVNRAAPPLLRPLLHRAAVELAKRPRTAAPDGDNAGPPEERS